jgi:cadmium resistance protein CadD (predicted permease)
VPGPIGNGIPQTLMERLIATVTTATALFVGTNLDDIVVLALLNIASCANGSPKAWQIWTGQYAGTAVLVGASLLASLGLTLLPENGTWLLGLVPLGLGLYKLVVAVRAQRSGADTSIAPAAGLFGVTAITVANGGDNIAAYTPVFRTSSAGDMAVTLCVFGLGVALWCAAGSWLASRRTITRAIGRWGHWIVPAVFVVIGVCILYKAGVLAF